MTDDYHVRPIGFVRSSLRSRAEAPRQGDEGAPDAWLVLRDDVSAGTEGIAVGDELIVITWLHEADRVLLSVRPRGDATRPRTGVFATRSPDRPNPLGLHRVRVLDMKPREIEVSRLEAIDGTPVIDIKPVLESAGVPREGFRTITPRIVVADAMDQIAFLRAVFGAEGEAHADRPSEMLVGDSVVMVTPAGVREPFPAFLYVYVEEADAVYRRAIAAGAVTIEAPLDTPYGDRRAMVRDPFGNVWQIAHVIAAR
jgi:tRNA-Thr(GGU) m(6)t(6)A37 methyltransferase TsaA